MAKAYKRLAEIHDLERLGELAPGKVTSMAEAMRHREQSEYGRGGAHDPALITFAPASDAKI
ncbi:hypothetical protein [Sphingomonas sp.]|uniref:hypothetical protein n=1 Tax=Sphingomonas sp. TaxID=28214 RepID=UPI0038AA0A4D